MARKANDFDNVVFFKLFRAPLKFHKINFNVHKFIQFRVLEGSAKYPE
jgi:hypothetical protein